LARYRTWIEIALSCAGLAVLAWYLLVWGPSQGTLGFDCYSYWAVSAQHPYGVPLGVVGSFTLTPAAALAFAPAHLLPFAFFYLFWAGLGLLCLVWLTGRYALAWLAFVQTVPGMDSAVLYLHTSSSVLYGGINLEGLLESIQLPQRNYRLVHQPQYDTGALAPGIVRQVYQAADVLLNPSMGGGFELPCVEAQACGVPVIASDWTAMRETVGAGWRISAGPGTGEPIWSELGGFRLQVTRAAIVEALKQAVARKDDAQLKVSARQHALRYSTATVYDMYWAPALAELEALLVAGDLTHEPTLIQPNASAVERAGVGGPVALRLEPEGPARVDDGGLSGDGRRELSAVP